MTSHSKNLKILITGGAGFIGSHLAEKLLQIGHSVLVIDDLSTGKYENILGLISNPDFHFYQESIFNESILKSLVSQVDLIFHLAAVVGVKLIVEDPIRTIQTNIGGTEILLNLADQYRKKTLIASTSEVYGKSEQLPFHEGDDVLIGSTQKNRWSYAVSKMIDEFLALAYFKQKQLPIVLFRLFNTVGPRQSAQYGMVLPRFVTQALERKPLTIYGDGRQTRCFCDVEDVISAIIQLVESEQAIGQVFNIGSEREISIEDLSEKVIELVAQETGEKKSAFKKKYLSYEEAYSADFEEMKHRKPSIDKIHRLTGWKPKTSLEETIQKIIRSKK